MCEAWKQGQVTWGEYRHCPGVQRHGLGQPKLTRIRDLNGHRKVVYRQLSMKRMTMEHVDLLQKWHRDLLTGHVEDSEVLRAFFTLIFTDKLCVSESQAPETWGKVWSKADLALLEKDLIKEHLNNLDKHKSLEPDEYSQEVLRELSHVTASSPPIICEGCADE